MTRPALSRVPRLLAVAVATMLAVITVLAAAGCGISSDDSPRDLAASTSTSTTVPQGTQGNAPAVLYFVQGKFLVPITRSLPERTEQAILESLLKAPTPQDGANLSSSIPAGTELLRLQREGTLLRVDLSKEFEGVVGPDRQQAVAQMVLSETGKADSGDDGVQRLTFSIDGDPFKVTSPSRGDVSEVTSCDFTSLLAEPGGVGVDLTEGQGTLLKLRRDELARNCPQVKADG